MKKIMVIAIACVAIMTFAGCASSDPKVERVSNDTVTDLSGYWNDTDIRIVADSLIEECLRSPRITGFEKRTYPVFIVGTFRNDSDEHIDTSILAKKMETALINSGRVDFVASKSEREELREERVEQQEWASEDTASALANETGADFMLIGSVKTSVDMIAGKSTRSYFVYAELIDVETNRKVWMGENDEIKKIITQPKARL